MNADKARPDYKGGIEQARRDFKRDWPKLYAYITAHEVERALDGAGDTLSGAIDGKQAANRLWRLSSQVRERRSRLASEPWPPAGSS